LFGNLVFEIAGFAPKELYKVDEFKARFKALYNFAVLPFFLEWIRKIGW
jgi:endo-1,4-beta-xylanase